MKRSYWTREAQVEELAQHLRRHKRPRLAMACLLTVSSLAGLLTSYVLLKAGVDKMAWRYPLSVVASYSALLLQLWAWLTISKNAAMDVAGRMVEGASDALSLSTASADAASQAGSAADMVDLGIVADEGAVFFWIILVAIVVMFSAGYLVYVAPSILADVMLDTAAGYGLLATMGKGSELSDFVGKAHWYERAVERTIVVFFITCAVMFFAGLALDHYAPGAHSLPEVIKHAQVSRTGK